MACHYFGFFLLLGVYCMEMQCQIHNFRHRQHNLTEDTYTSNKFLICLLNRYHIESKHRPGRIYTKNNIKVYKRSFQLAPRYSKTKQSAGTASSLREHLIATLCIFIYMHSQSTKQHFININFILNKTILFFVFGTTQ